MLEEYLHHNLFWDNITRFSENDPHLSLLKGLKFVHPLDWWREIDWRSPGIYILTGGRQIGKSTSTKLLIQEILRENKFRREHVFYLPCDQIENHHHLTQIIRTFLETEIKDDSSYLLILDEITFVQGWDRGIKALADEGVFRKGFCILTGSDTIILKEAVSRFPGRRGDANKVDFHLYPFTFRDYLQLVEPSLLKEKEKSIEALFIFFGKYLQCGGFLKAINQLHRDGTIREATYQTFEQWIKGDFEKRGKKSRFLEEILSVLFTTSSSQVTYSDLATKTSHLSKDTFIEYCHLLERMDLLSVSDALNQNTRRGFPKKAKKIYFSDPFVIDMIEKWLMRERWITKPMDESIKVETTVAANYKRYRPVYYIKNKGEVDIAIITDKGFLPIEIKWTHQLKERDLKEVLKFKNGLILTQQTIVGEIDGVKTIPLPLFLIEEFLY